MAEDRKNDENEAREGSFLSGETFVVQTLEQVKALSHPLRQRILERFAIRPRTTKQVADELGEKPTRLYFHVNALEKAGLIRLVETRPKRGTTEKYFSAVAERFALDPRAVVGAGPGLTDPQGALAVLDGLFETTRSELVELAERKSLEDLAVEAVFLKLELRGTSESIASGRKRLEELIRELEAEQSDEENTEVRQRLLVGWYPSADST